MKNEKKAIKFLVVFFILLMLTFVLYGFINRTSLNNEFLDGISKYGAPALFIISIFLDMVPQVISPIMVLITGIFMGINIHCAILATILGSISGSVLGFFIGKKYMLDAVDVMVSKKAVRRLTYLINKYGKIIIPLAAISPLPYLPVVIGTMNFSKRNFILYGLIPRILSFIVFGYLIYLFQLIR